MLTLISRFAKLLACLSGIILIACGNQDDAVVSIALHPTNPKILYVATNEAVHKTRDGGRSYERPPSPRLWTASFVATVRLSRMECDGAHRIVLVAASNEDDADRHASSFANLEMRVCVGV